MYLHIGYNSHVVKFFIYPFKCCKIISNRSILLNTEKLLTWGSINFHNILMICVSSQTHSSFHPYPNFGRLLNRSIFLSVPVKNMCTLPFIVSNFLYQLISTGNLTWKNFWYHFGITQISIRTFFSWFYNSAIIMNLTKFNTITPLQNKTLALIPCKWRIERDRFCCINQKVN